MQRELVLDEDKTVVDGLVRAFGAMLEEAKAQAKHAIVEPADAVHDYRRALRRAESVLALAAPMMRKPQRRWLTEAVASGRRRTRVLRDLDAVTPMLGKLRALEVLADGDLAIEALAVWLEQCRAELATEELVAWRLRKNVRALAGLADIFQVGLHAWADAEMVVESLRESYRQARKAWKLARTTLVAEDVHALRRAARTLRYQLELLSSRPTLPQHEALVSAHATFKAMVKDLGEVTDLMALRDVLNEAREDVVGVDLKGLERVISELLEARLEVAMGEVVFVFATRAKDFLAPAPAPSVAAEAPAVELVGVPSEGGAGGEASTVSAPPEGTDAAP